MCLISFRFFLFLFLLFRFTTTGTTTVLKNPDYPQNSSPSNQLQWLQVSLVARVVLKDLGSIIGFTLLDIWFLVALCLCLRFSTNCLVAALGLCWTQIIPGGVYLFICWTTVSSFHGCYCCIWSTACARIVIECKICAYLVINKHYEMVMPMYCQ